MVRRAQTTTVVERVTMLERATAGETDSMIATALGCSIWTVRKWHDSDDTCHSWRCS